MADVVVIVGVVGFLAICVAYVAGCDRVVGPDAPADDAQVGEVDAVSLPSVPGTAR
jgi:hypothetical protein